MVGEVVNVEVGVMSSHGQDHPRSAVTAPPHQAMLKERNGNRCEVKPLWGGKAMKAAGYVAKGSR